MARKPAKMDGLDKLDGRTSREKIRDKMNDLGIGTKEAVARSKAERSVRPEPRPKKEAMMAKAKSSGKVSKDVKPHKATPAKNEPKAKSSGKEKGFLAGKPDAARTSGNRDSRKNTSANDRVNKGPRAMWDPSHGG